MTRPSRPALLMVHGFGDTSDTWSVLRGECARRGLYTSAVDLPGFRRGAPLRPGPVLPQLDAFVTATARRLREREGAVVIVGNSLGGTLALRTAATSAADAVVALAPASVRLSGWLRRMTNSPVTARASRLPVPPQVVRSVMGLGYGRLVAGAPGRSARVAGRRFSAGYDRRSASAAAALGVRLLPELDTSCDPAAVRCPATLVWGSLDRLVPVRGAQRLADELPQGELVVLDGVGHCPQVEKPRRVADVIDDVIARLPAAAVRA
jgi:pimeloyl-ACP methyl ester carboxylesterase